MRVRWSEAAANDLAQIADYLREHNPGYVPSTVREIYESIRSLKSFPNRGRLGRKPGTRELVLGRLPYLVVYQVQLEAVVVLRICHAAQNRP